MIKRVLTITLAIFLLATIAGMLYLFLPPQVKAEWDTSPDARIITVGYRGEVDYNYIPDVQVWGDGRMIWVEHDVNGKRRVLEGYLSKEKMTELINRLIEAGFFKRYRRFNWDVEFGTTYLDASLSNVHHQITIDPISEYDNEAILDLVDFLKSGAGTIGMDFVPAVGMLLAYPLEEVDFPHDAKANLQWPDNEFGYGLEAVYTNKPHNERQIIGEELVFAWEIVNSPQPLVESEGKVYWIAVVVPKVSPF